MKYKILAILVILAISFCLMLTGCKTESKSIKIGAVFSISGANAFLGEPEKNTLEMVVNKYNAGNPKTKIELSIYDDEGDATKAQNLTTKLIEEDKCLVIIGPTTTGSSMKVLDEAQSNSTPLISCASGAGIVEPVNERKWIFKTAPHDRDAVTRLYKYLFDKNLKNIALISVANGFGQSGKTFLEQKAGDFGIKLVANETFNAQDTDMKAQLTKIKSLKPDAIICWGTNPGPAYVVRNARELGIKIPIYQSHGVANKDYIKLAGADVVEGTYLIAGKLLVSDTLGTDNPQKPVLEKYTNDYKELYKSDPSTFGGHSFDAISMVLKAIESGKIKGDLASQRSLLRDYIENETKGYVGIGGIFNYTKDDHNGVKETDFAIMTIKSGNWVFIE